MANHEGSWKNRHHLYLAVSGHGKSEALARNPLLKSKRRVLWDPNNDHMDAKIRVTTMGALVSALQDRGKQFDIAVRLTDPSVRSFELFCQAIYMILDGRYSTTIVIEELWRVSPGPGDATKHWGRLLFEGRKYGAVILAAAQRSQRISKDVYTQCDHQYCGCMDYQDAKVLAQKYRVSIEEIEKLPVGSFFYKQRREDTVLIDFIDKKRVNR